MGRRIVGFLVGLVISGVIFSVVAILSDDARAPRDGSEIAEQALVEPEISEPLPVREPKPVETVEEPAAEPLRPEPVEPEVEEKPAVVAEPAKQELPEEEAPMVVVEPAPQPAPAPNDTPQPKLAEPAVPAPLKKPGALTEVAPAPQPVAPVPNPPVEIARAEPEPEPEPVSAPEPEPAPEPQVESQPVPDAPAVVEVEPEVRQAPTEPPAEPVVRQSRLPVVSDDTSQSAGIQFGRPRTSTLPTVTSPDVADDPAVPSVTPFREAPPLVSAKRLVAPKSAEPESDTVTILTVEPEEPEAAPQKRRAIDAYGVLFDQGEKPTMSIILVDVGNAGVPLNEAATQDLPITFAVAVDRSDATLAAKTYFESGHEVLALSPRSVQLSLSGGQSEEQVADLLTEFFAIVPQSVGLLDVPEATLQNDRVLSNHVLAALHETGHGVVTYEQGLNVVLREADKAGVPAGLIYRALDQKGESVDAIKRHLDRAATEASRSGHVLVIGSTRADTIEAIQSWTQSRAAQNVALAPVSASIKGNY
jgi:polysaccharide deacetylase 2 family uncharacterized protein YibQ